MRILRSLAWLIAVPLMPIGFLGYVIFVAVDWVVSWADDLTRPNRCPP